MVKKPLNLLVDEDIVKKARDHGLNLSKFFENQLRGYFNFIDGKHNNYSHYGKQIASDNHKEKEIMDLSGFEPEASSMPRSQNR